ncbi:MAG: transcriptional repressor [Hespellia sp.]|nr:transcriptional repressor [Hespellia sp.]
MQQEVQRERIVQELKNMGCRITKQRLLLLDVILNEECTCCKEIYYKARNRKIDVGIATVYRMVNTLENIGAIDRKKMYQVAYQDPQDHHYIVEMDDGTTYHFTEKKMDQVLSEGLKAVGYANGKKVQKIKMSANS